jgi:hypothetical protein
VNRALRGKGAGGEIVPVLEACIFVMATYNSYPLVDFISRLGWLMNYSSDNVNYILHTANINKKVKGKVHPVLN